MSVALVNRSADRSAVPAPVQDAWAFHRRLDGYRPTPVHALPRVAAELQVGSVLVKD